MEHVSPSRNSIDRKLPLFISALLLVTTVGFAWATYVRARHTLLAAAAPRVRGAESAVNLMITQSLAVYSSRLARVAANPAVSTFLATGRDTAAARSALARVWMGEGAAQGRVALRRPDGRVALDTSVGVAPAGRWADQLVRGDPAPDTTPRVGPLESAGNVVFYEAVAPILSHERADAGSAVGTSRRRIVGYILDLRTLTGTGAQGVRDLIGASSTMLLGSTASGVWTDLEHPTGPPPKGMGIGKPQAFALPGRPPGVGMATPVRGAPWVLWVELPQSVVLAPMRPLLRDVAVIACLVILIGGCGAWFLSRHITGPIVSLTAAAERIAAGADPPAGQEDKDEVGRLSEAFKRMAQRVSASLAAAESARIQAETLAGDLREQTVTLEMQRREARALADELEQQFEEAQSLSEELEQSNQQLQESVKQAEAANKAKLDFLTHMSHELRTPLNAISGYVQLLDMQVAGPVGEEQRRYLARIARAESLLLGRINDILNFAKIDSGTLMYAMDAVAVHDALASALSLMQPLLAQRGLTCTYDGADPTVTIVADREKVEQILLNLLSNAAKFTPRGGHVTMLATAHAATVEISVADTGVGIPADKLTTIFEPFVQVSSTLTREHEGTGLGLAISRELARAMGGDVTAASTERAGSTFTLTLTRGEKMVSRAGGVGQAEPEVSVRAVSLRS